MLLRGAAGGRGGPRASVGCRCSSSESSSRGGESSIVGAAAARRRALLLGGGAAAAGVVLPPPRAALAARHKRAPGGEGGDSTAATTAAGSRPPLPPIPRVQLAPGLVVSRIIKGCWQLDGKHHGDPVTDRTAGGPAIDDMERFARAGVTAFDTSDAFGPSEALIGQFRSLSPRAADGVTVLTKLTFMGDPGPGATSREMIE